MTRDTEPKSISPEKAIIEVVVQGAMRYGIGPTQAGEYLQELAGILTPISENQRIDELTKLIDPNIPNRSLIKKIAESGWRLHIDPIKLFQFNMDFVTVVLALPEEMRSQAIDPDFLNGIAGHLKGKM